MTTAVDTNVLFDFLSPESARGEAAERALREWHIRGSLIICEVVFAEASPAFEELTHLEEFLLRTGVRRVESSPTALFLAGAAWKRYLNRRVGVLVCPNCGSSNEIRCSACGASLRSRQHLMPDFLIGAHARVAADRLLTRDRGFYKTYFTGLDIVSY